MHQVLSFEPRYHELTEREGQPVWVPMYNLIRECVESECQRILGEAGVVDSTAWKRPVVNRIGAGEMCRIVWGTVKLLLGALLVGGLLTSMPHIGPWLKTLPVGLWPAVIIAMGTGTLAACSFGLALALVFNSGRR